jgi:hypothetical protein
MSQETAKSAPASSEKKPGFFSRIFQKLDSSLKQKAEAKEGQSCCKGGGKGGSCC